MTTPTVDDARLILQLYDMRREARLREARRWFVASFKAKTLAELHSLCPPGSEENASYRQVTTYYELVASFLTSGVLNAELFYQSGRELLLVWERLKHVLPELRAANQNPFEYGNLEVAAEAFIAWWKARTPDAYEAFRKRIGG